ncbi:RICIN domain-containing protein [Actinomadura barringtoniae]|uniref:RICIN domain-containing protein n=1 Tax=Actinomadura barringtoniae TaxID=1427535 RepID=A0A939TG83_9ACTN|nr:RICIN domain-containing protein [Actinomadura barringtoniae]MBO2455170.1 RICIN domain-containing protein [Actinomadura barringtoniae]
MALAAVPASLAVVVTGAPAQAEELKEFHTWAGTRKCLDVVTQNNTTVKIWRCSGADEQKWADSVSSFRNDTTRNKSPKTLEAGEHARNAITASAVILEEKCTVEAGLATFQ